MKTLIKNGKVLYRGRFAPLDILIDGERIAEVGESLPAARADTVVNASGKYVFHGLFDMHCHLREPGQTHKEDIRSGAFAALKGGYTAVACMPNTLPPIDAPELVEFVLDRAAAAGYADVYPIACLTKGMGGIELTDFAALKKAGAVAVSDDGRPVAEMKVMKEALFRSAEAGITLISHCEDFNVPESTAAGVYGSETAMVDRDIELSKMTGGKVHIAHVSCAASVHLLRTAKKKGVSVTAETCPQYFALTEDELAEGNANAKMNPPLRTAKDAAEIVSGLADGTIDAISTDHAPHAAAEKNVALDKAANGTVGLETAFSAGVKYLVKTGAVTLERLIELMCFNPVSILGVKGGHIREGAEANLVVADLNASFRVNAAKLASKSKNSVFDGKILEGKIQKTFLRGKMFEW